MSRLFKLLLNYPRTIIGGSIFVTLLFLWQIPALELDPSMKAMIAKDHPVRVNMDMIDSLFTGSEIVIVGVKSDSLLSKHTLTKFEALHDSLENIEQFIQVFSLYNARDIISTEDGFVVEDFLEEYPTTAEEIKELKAKLIGNDLVYGNMVTEDFCGMAFICQLSSSFDYDEYVLRDQIIKLKEHFEGPEEFYYSGMPVIRAAISKNMQIDMKTFMPYGIFLMIILLSLSFRSWLGVFMPLSVVIISVIWTFGMMSLLGIKLVFIGVIIPVMLIAIANDYGIHIIAHYYEYTKSDPEILKAEIIRKTLRKLRAPIFIAGLTTIIGFLSLMGHVLPRIKELGWLVSFGILVAFVMSLLFIPAALLVANRPKFLSQEHSLDKMNRFLHGWGKFFINFRKPFLLIMAAVLIFVGLGIQRIVVDTDPDHYYNEDNPIRINNNAITEMFGGATQISIQVNGDIKEPETLRKIDQVASHLEKNPLVSRTASIVDQIKKMHCAFHGGKKEFEVIPDNRQLIAQYLFLYSLTGDESDFDQFIDDIDYPENAHLIVRLKKIKTSQIVKMVEDTEDYIRANLFGVPITLTGAAALIGELAKMIVRGQMVSLSVSLVIIFIIMTFIFRSFVGGLLSIIPLGTAIILVFGLMGYLNIELNMATAMLTSIMIGVGVDYTVHFLWHLREHIRSGQKLEEAIYTTLRISGKGIVFNALSVIIGFTVLTLSVFLPVYFFGFLIMLSISMCLFGSLALLPAIVSWINPKFLHR
ncbi:MAG: RND family transporter [Candidatus Marinimicrobia bacterium]|nr:RND family transporter [Candidatus Neomarinimicrobiota bacterium]MBL7046152.1 RND family transporter [Candidatus Neomarinimicrobiota bacterium]